MLSHGLLGPQWFLDCRCAASVPEGALFGRVQGRPLPEWAGELGAKSWAQLFLKWILGHPAVTCVIPASSKVSHLRDNLTAGTGPIPDAAQRQRLARLFD